MNIRIRRHEMILQPDSSRVLIRPFITADPAKVTTIIGRALELSDEEVATEVASLRVEFDSRHLDMDAILDAHFERVASKIFTQRQISADRRLLIGALFSGEYALL